MNTIEQFKAQTQEVLQQLRDGNLRCSPETMRLAEEACSRSPAGDDWIERVAAECAKLND